METTDSLASERKPGSFEIVSSSTVEHYPVILRFAHCHGGPGKK